MDTGEGVLGKLSFNIKKKKKTNENVIIETYKRYHGRRTILSINTYDTLFFSHPTNMKRTGDASVVVKIQLPYNQINAIIHKPIVAYLSPEGAKTYHFSRIFLF